MTVDFISLAVIVIVAAVCPVIAHAVPNKLIPESVFLLIAGAVLGPNCLGIIQTDEVVSFLSELGLGFLFMLAGMEINPRTLAGRQGRRAFITWAISLGLAFALVIPLLRDGTSPVSAIAVAIALTTTAFGTLVPIMKERGLGGTPVGDAIVAYGTWGELGPVLAIAILLSARSQLQTVIILIGFAGLCVLMAVIPRQARKAGSRVFKFLNADESPTYQTMMRVTVMTMVILVAVSAIFDLDIVLGAFAAGFVMRAIEPEGNESLEDKLNGLAYGLFIPLFFVVSGAKVNLMAVSQSPLVLVAFIVMLMLVRGLPVFISLFTDRKSDLSVHNKWTVAIYCTTALPLIVAVTSIAVSAGAMSQDTASVLVASGAITVFLLPLLASLTYRVADTKPAEALDEIRENPHDLARIIRQHAELGRLVALAQKQNEAALSEHGKALAEALKQAREQMGGKDAAPDGQAVRDEIARLRHARAELLEERGIDPQKAAKLRLELTEQLARLAWAEAQRQRADLEKHSDAVNGDGSR